MLKGIKRGVDLYEYILEGEKVDKDPTVFGLRPQTVGEGNVALAGYFKANQKKTDASVAAAMTKTDLEQWLTSVAFVRNFCFADEDAPRDELITDEKDLKRVFFELDISSANEVINASRDIFLLKEGSKNASGSLSGQGLSASTQTGSGTSAEPASLTD